MPASACDREITPDDLISIARLLLIYCQQYNRPINGFGIKRAKRLIGVAWRLNAQRWERDTNWRMKLNAAGLDPDTLEVRDPLRWAKASAQLLETGTWDWRADEVYDKHYERGVETYRARVTKKRENKLSRRKAWREKMERLEAKEQVQEPQHINQVQEMFRRKFGG
jgi:hypothetical protein